MSATVQVKYLRQKDVLWIAEHVAPMTVYLHNYMGGPGWSARRESKESPARYTFERRADLTMFLLSRPQFDNIISS